MNILLSKKLKKQAPLLGVFLLLEVLLGQLGCGHAGNRSTHSTANQSANGTCGHQNAYGRPDKGFLIKTKGRKRITRDGRHIPITINYTLGRIKRCSHNKKGIKWPLNCIRTSSLASKCDDGFGRYRSSKLCFLFVRGELNQEWKFLGQVPGPARGTMGQVWLRTS